MDLLNYISALPFKNCLITFFVYDFMANIFAVEYYKKKRAQFTS